MSEEDEKPVPTRAAAEPQGPLAGERLAEARRALQISVLEIAKELHLDEPKVRALENNEFDVLGAPVFAKGHLRKYAQLVGVDIDDVLADYYRLNRSQGAPPVVTARRKPARQFSPGPWIIGIVLVVVAAIAYWIVVAKPFDLPQPGTRNAQPADPAPAGTEAADQNPIVDDTAGSGAGDDAATTSVRERAPPPIEIRQESPRAAADEPVSQPASQPVSQPASESAGDSATDTGVVRLSVSFIGDCWTEITDASGRRLFFDLGRSGTSVDVSGEAPLTVLFGNADNVRLQVDGTDFTIADADRRGRTARFLLHGA